MRSSYKVVISLSPDRQRSPWGYDETSLSCPKCGSTKIVRVHNRWAMAHGFQIFKCVVCGKKFYDKDVDNYRPTY